jgi:hypothetical protein
MGAAALERQIDDFLSSDIFLGSDSGRAGVSRTEILIHQFHCCYGGISCHRSCADNSPLLHCKDRGIIFLAGLIFQKRKQRKIWAVARAANERGIWPQRASRHGKRRRPYLAATAAARRSRRDLSWSMIFSENRLPPVGSKPEACFSGSCSRRRDQKYFW